VEDIDAFFMLNKNRKPRGKMKDFLSSGSFQPINGFRYGSILFVSQGYVFPARSKGAIESKFNSCD
jgi:hypothetical protein